MLIGHSQGAGLLGALGINPGDWLTDLENEGTEDVAGTDTIRISATADVPKLADDLKKIAENAGTTAAGVDISQLDRLEEVIQRADFEVFSGEEDRILRRLEGRIELEPGDSAPGAPDSV